MSDVPRCRHRASITAALLTALGLMLLPGQAEASTTYWLWLYQRNWGDHTNGTLLFERYDYLYAANAWRAGSGSGEHPYDECWRGQGWLPAGQYTVQGYSYNWPGTAVRGPVLWLSNRRCHDGTLRTELFVHSSYPWSESRYQSLGCIKASNTSGPSPASGDISWIVDTHVVNGQPVYLVVQ